MNGDPGCAAERVVPPGKEMGREESKYGVTSAVLVGATQ